MVLKLDKFHRCTSTWCTHTSYATVPPITRTLNHTSAEAEHFLTHEIPWQKNRCQ